TFTVSGLTTWSGGSMFGASVTNANGGLTMTGNLSLLARTFNNAALATYNGGAGNTFTISNSTFNNLAGGTFTVDGNNDFSGAGDVTAAGLVVHAGSGFTTTNFNAGSSYTVTGTTQIVSGVHSFNSTANTTATLVMTGGGLAGSGTLTVSGPTTWSGGTMS